MAKKFATSTKLNDGTISPWLAASGPLAYTPENPPDSNYFFQYSWLMPGIFPDKKHYYFGYWSSLSKRDSYEDIAIEFLVRFWDQAKTGRVTPVAVRHGKITDQGFQAPIACYSYRERRKQTDSYMFIQHGSYLSVPAREQPHIHNGKILLYRGIGKSNVFNFFTPNYSTASTSYLESLHRYWIAHVHAFSDSETSFSVAHSRIHRSETDFLNTEADWTSIANMVGLEWTDCQFARLLRACYLQSFTLDQQIAKNKFGPNYVVCETAIDNLRMTTFYAGEKEVFIIDPSRVKIIGTNGCKLELFELENSNA